MLNFKLSSRQTADSRQTQQTDSRQQTQKRNKRDRGRRRREERKADAHQKKVFVVVRYIYTIYMNTQSWRPENVIIEEKPLLCPAP